MSTPPAGPATIAVERTSHAGRLNGRRNTPMVLIHGVGTNRSIWSRAIPRLSEGREVITLDLPGFGGSPPPERGWVLPEVAETVAERLDALIDGPYDLVGSSLGGAVSICLAARRPAAVSHLLLAAPAGFRPTPEALARIGSNLVGPLLLARRTAGLRFADRAHFRRALLAGTVGDGAALDPDTARLVLKASEGAVSLTAAFEAAARADLREEFARVKAPVGLIWGSLDRVIPGHTAEKLLELRPDAPIEVINDAGHIPHLEVPQRFAAAVERLLSQLPDTP